MPSVGDGSIRKSKNTESTASEKYRNQVARLGCPRERFLNSRKARESVLFLQAFNHAYYTHHIKNLQLSGDYFGHKILTWLITENFLKWHLRKL